MGKGTIRNGRRIRPSGAERPPPRHGTQDAAPQQAHHEQKDEGSRPTGKRTIPPKARPTAEIPPVYVSVNNKSFPRTSNVSSVKLSLA